MPSKRNTPKKRKKRGDAKHQPPKKKRKLTETASKEKEYEPESDEETQSSGQDEPLVRAPKRKKKAEPMSTDEMSAEEPGKRAHGKKVPGQTCYYFDPAQMSDASDSEDEDSKTESSFEKYGRKQTFCARDGKIKKIKTVAAERGSGKRKEYQIIWPDTQVRDWLPYHQVEHTEQWITFIIKTKWKAERSEAGTTQWTKADDRLLGQLTARPGYKKKSGAFSIYKFSRRTKRSLISIRNRLKRAEFIKSKAKKRKKKKPKKDPTVRDVLEEKTCREGAGFESVSNNFASRKFETDKVTKAWAKDLKMDAAQAEKRNVYIPSKFPSLKKANIILIVGEEGVGKSSLLSQFGDFFKPPEWSETKAVISEFEKYEEGEKCMSCIGLNSITSWMKPYKVLSQGEAYRALLAFTIAECFSNPGSKIVLDNFTNTLDRVSARNCAAALNKCVRREEEFKECQWVLATSNRDVIPFLQPDVILEVTKDTVITHKNPNKSKKPLVKARINLDEASVENKNLRHLIIPTEDFGDLTVTKTIDTMDKPVIKLQTVVTNDEATVKASCAFDTPPATSVFFYVPAFPEEEVDEDFNVALITGPSGSGKTSMAHQYFGAPFVAKFAANKSVLSFFPNLKKAKEIFKVLLLDPKEIFKTFDKLNSSAQERVNIARGLYEAPECLILDEFTSSMERRTAQLVAKNISQYARAKGIKVVLVACHQDLVGSNACSPDWWFSTKSQTLSCFELPSEFAESSFPEHVTDIVWTVPEMVVDVKRCHRDRWYYFALHHYKDHNLSNMAQNFALFVTYKNLEIPCDLIGWASAMVGMLPNAELPGTPRREHRTVVLPDYQGLGFASRSCDAIGEMYYHNACVFQSKTAHPRYGSYRDRSSLWEAANDNHKVQKKANNWKDPFKTKQERDANVGWKKLQNNYQPHFYYNHRYLGAKADPVFFKSRVIFEREKNEEEKEFFQDHLKFPASSKKR